MQNSLLPNAKQTNKKVVFSGHRLTLAIFFVRILNTYRHPGGCGDWQESTDGRRARGAEHVVVMRRGRVFSVQVKKDGGWVGADTMAEILRHILVRQRRKKGTLFNPCSRMAFFWVLTQPPTVVCKNSLVGICGRCIHTRFLHV